MYTLMEHCLDRIDVFEYMSYMEEGLKAGGLCFSTGLLCRTATILSCSTC